ncbi:PREDICTED: interleukin-23 receptor [Pseudopodoces humilis]|uniref:interleukin-23 receptor n=1 Tax=Pseudopodoces humilis TaxID=181119 RepID=UPI0006B74B2A|nr:PREDICTED: interleukin-23 receptor [Pseudopodoces humilis]
MAGSGEALVLPVLLCCLCRGAANIECKGRVWIEPAPVVRMGSNISIGCQSSLSCPSVQLDILLNYSHAEGSPLPGGTVRLRLRDFRMPLATVTCLSRCGDSQWRGVVCGTELRAGYPPDPPGNLSCATPEGSGSLECSWDQGQDTLLPTRHSLHLRRVVAEDEEDEEEKIFPADSPVPLRELNNESLYSVWVQASNALGTARSSPRHLSLQEIVVPALPVIIGADTSETSPAITSTRWRSRTRLQNVQCQERHRATGTPAWHVELCDTVTPEGPRWHHELQSDTEFVFQVRCRLSTAHRPWSAWSPPFFYRTPETVPAAPAVWRRLGPALPNGSHEVTVLIKPARDARGRILSFAVSAQSPEGPRLLCLTSGSECSVLVPPGARSLLVTARNSKGSSSPASIPLERGEAREEFPAPGAVEVKPEEQSRFLVRWQRPRHSRSPPLWFVLEWDSSSQHGQNQLLLWEKIPQHQTHTYIQAAGAPLRVRLYAVYPDGISQASSSPVPAEEPLLGSAHGEMSQDDIRVFLGLSLSVLGLSVLFAIVMFKKSVRKRTKATLVSLLPKWLFEDFPRMENSKVVKSLQDQGDFPSESPREPFPACGDPAVTELQEVPAQERSENLDTEEPRELPRSVVVTPSSPSPEQLGAYKPQLSIGTTPGYVAAGIHPQPAAAPPAEMGIFSQDYSNPVPQLWQQQGGPAQVCLLEKIHLVLNSSQEFPEPAGRGSFPEKRWEQRPPSDVPEQMLVPEELLSCLRAVNREPVDGNPCFPQSVGGLLGERLELG